MNLKHLVLFFFVGLLSSLIYPNRIMAETACADYANSAYNGFIVNCSESKKLVDYLDQECVGKLNPLQCSETFNHDDVPCWDNDLWFGVFDNIEMSLRNHGCDGQSIDTEISRLKEKLNADIATHLAIGTNTVCYSDFASREKTITDLQNIGTSDHSCANTLNEGNDFYSGCLQTSNNLKSIFIDTSNDCDSSTNLSTFKGVREVLKDAYVLRSQELNNLPTYTPTPTITPTPTPAYPAGCQPFSAVVDVLTANEKNEQFCNRPGKQKYCLLTQDSHYGAYDATTYGCCDDKSDCAGLIDYYQSLPNEQNILYGEVLDSDDFLNDQRIKDTENTRECGKLNRACCIEPYMFDPVVSSSTPNSLLGKVSDWVFGSIRNAMNTALFPVARSMLEMRSKSLCSEGDAAFYIGDTFMGKDSDQFSSITTAIETSWSENTVSGWNNNWIKYKTDNRISCACADPRREIKTSKSSDEDIYKLSDFVPDLAVNHTVRYRIGNLNTSATVLTAICVDSPNKNICEECAAKSYDYISGPKGDACLFPASADRCDSIRKTNKDDNQKEYEQCLECTALGGGGTWTAVGCFYNDLSKTISEKIFGWALGLAGGVALLCIIYASIRMQLSSGNPEKVQHAQEMITSCITGLIMIIFSILILRIIGVDILRIPGFGS